MDLKDFSQSPDIQAGEILRAIEVAISPEAIEQAIAQTQRRPFAPVTYFAFDSWDEAHNFGSHRRQALHTSKGEESERFTSTLGSEDLEHAARHARELIRAMLLVACPFGSHTHNAQELPLPPVRRD